MNIKEINRRFFTECLINELEMSIKEGDEGIMFKFIPVSEKTVYTFIEGLPVTCSKTYLNDSYYLHPKNTVIEKIFLKSRFVDTKTLYNFHCLQVQNEVLLKAISNLQQRLDNIESKSSKQVEEFEKIIEKNLI